MLIGLGCVQSDDSSLWKNMHSFERSKSGGAGGLLVQRALSEKKNRIVQQKTCTRFNFCLVEPGKVEPD